MVHVWLQWKMQRKTAGEMIDRYVLYYNKARQASITMELLDIVNCSEAINK